MRTRIICFQKCATIAPENCVSCAHTIHVCVWDPGLGSARKPGQHVPPQYYIDGLCYRSYQPETVKGSDRTFLKVLSDCKCKGHLILTCRCRRERVIVSCLRRSSSRLGVPRPCTCPRPRPHTRVLDLQQLLHTMTLTCFTHVRATSAGCTTNDVGCT